jgi:hypothetical protein
MVTKLDANGTLITFSDVSTPAAPSFGASIYYQSGVFYQKTLAGVIGTLTNAAGTPGSVTSVSVLTTIPGLASAGSPITVDGTIILSGTLTPGGGGTGIGSYTAGDMLYATGAQTLAKLAIGANRSINISNGTIPTWTTLVSGDLPTVPVNKGGTGQTTATEGFDALAPTTTAGDIIYNNGTDNVRLGIGTALQVLRTNAGATAPEWATATSGSTPLFYRSGLQLAKQTAAILEVGIGEMTVESTIVSKTTTTLLTMSTAGDWIGGASLESASEYVQVYADAAGNLKLYDKMPNYPRANTASRVAVMRVNQAGWNGTAGSGLNATAIIYDTDTGEGSVTAGMLLGVYSDATAVYETGRGRGSAAAGSVNNASFALITAIDTGTNTITVAAGHNIAINDNDYLIVIEFGALEYINVSSTWYRLVGRMFNNSSSDLDDAQLTKRAYYTLDEGADLTTASTSFVAASTKLSLSILTGGGDIHGDFFAVVTNGANVVYLDISLDSIAIANDGATISGGASVVWSQAFHRQFGVLPGTHNLEVRWKVSAGTATMYAGAGTAAFDLHPQLTVYEVENQ